MSSTDKIRPEISQHSYLHSREPSSSNGLIAFHIEGIAVLSIFLLGGLAIIGLSGYGLHSAAMQHLTGKVVCMSFYMAIGTAIAGISGKLVIDSALKIQRIRAQLKQIS